jgi:hypothetical protein
MGLRSGYEILDPEKTYSGSRIGNTGKNITLSLFLEVKNIIMHCGVLLLLPPHLTHNPKAYQYEGEGGSEISSSCLK